MSPNEIELICDRLDRIEAKLDKNIECQGQKIPRVECDKHRESIWHCLDGLSKKIYLLFGGLIVVQVVVVPLILWILMKG